MRWVRVKTQNGPSYGIINNDIISLVRGNLFETIELTGEEIKLANAKIMVPLEPKTFYAAGLNYCLLYTSPSPRDATLSRMPSSA